MAVTTDHLKQNLEPFTPCTSMDPLGIAIWCITQTYFLNGEAFYHKPTQEYEFLSENKQVYLRVEQDLINDLAWQVAKKHGIKKGVTANGKIHYWFAEGGNNEVTEFVDKLIEQSNPTPYGPN